MSGRRRFIYPNGFHRAMRLCFRLFDAVKLMTSGASPIAQMSAAVSARHGNSCLTREGCGPGTRCQPAATYHAAIDPPTVHRLPRPCDTLDDAEVLSMPAVRLRGSRRPRSLVFATAVLAAPAA